MKRILRGLICSLSLLAGTAYAQDLEAAQAQWLQGKRQQALAMVQQALEKNPSDARLRFARAVMQMDLGQSAEAETGLVALTQDFPDLADPYNNLAVLYAARGELDLSRATLEQALRLQPEHAQALENLGDVMLRLAARAYTQALKLGQGDTGALQRKSRDLQGLIEPPPAAASKP